MPRVEDLETVQVRLTGAGAAVRQLAAAMSSAAGVVSAGGVTVKTRSADVVQGYLTVILERNRNARDQ